MIGSGGGRVGECSWLGQLRIVKSSVDTARGSEASHFQVSSDVVKMRCKISGAPPHAAEIIHLHTGTQRRHKSRVKCVFIANETQTTQHRGARRVKEKYDGESVSVPGKTVEVMSVIFLGNPKQLEPLLAGRVGEGKLVT